MDLFGLLNSNSCVVFAMYCLYFLWRCYLHKCNSISRTVSKLAFWIILISAINLLLFALRRRINLLQLAEQSWIRLTCTGNSLFFIEKSKELGKSFKSSGIPNKKAISNFSGNWKDRWDQWDSGNSSLKKKKFKPSGISAV